MFLPIMWESHALPVYNGYDTQEILNEQFVRDSDMLISTLWTKIGNPTYKSASGTIEEIEEFIHQSKPVLIYFSNRELPNDVDLEGLKKLRKFKDEYIKKGIFSVYKDLSELEKFVYDNLSQQVEKLSNKVSTSNKRTISFLNNTGYWLKINTTRNNWFQRINHKKTSRIIFEHYTKPFFKIKNGDMYVIYDQDNKVHLLGEVEQYKDLTIKEIMELDDEGVNCGFTQEELIESFDKNSTNDTIACSIINILERFKPSLTDEELSTQLSIKPISHKKYPVEKIIVN